MTANIGYLVSIHFDWLSCFELSTKQCIQASDVLIPNDFKDAKQQLNKIMITYVVTEYLISGKTGSV